MPGSDSKTQWIPFLLNDCEAVCLISVRHIRYQNTHELNLEFQQAGEISPLAFHHWARIQVWECNELISGIRSLLQDDQPLTFRNELNTLRFEIAVDTIMADRFRIKVELYGSLSAPRRVGEVLYDQVGVTLNLNNFETTRDALSQLRAALIDHD